MNNARIALLVWTLALPSVSVAEPSQTAAPSETAAAYRCLAPQSCQLQQWFINASVGVAKGNVSQQDVINDAAALGFEVFDIDLDDNRTGYKVGVGLHLVDQWELEAGYLDLGEVKAAFSAITLQPDDFFEQTNRIHPLSADGAYLSTKYKVIDEIDWQLAVKAGVFFWRGDYDSLNVFDNVPVANLQDDSGSDVFYGLGAAYRLSDQINLTADLERYKIGDQHTLLWSAGLRYYF